MAFPVLPLIGAIAPPIIGGAFSAHAQKKQNKANQKAQAAQNAENARVAALERQQALEDDQTRFQRLRSAAEAAGFNPLTALQFGGTTSNLGSGVSADQFIANQVFDWGPTVSAALTAALPELSGQADVARTREALEQDLLKVQADALRASTTVAQHALTAASAFQPIGGSGAYSSTGGAASSRAVGSSSAVVDLAPNRPVERKPVENIAGVMQVENAITGNKPAWVWGSDGDPWDIWQHAAVWGQIAPQMVKDTPFLAPSFGEMFTIEEDSPVGRLRESIRNWAGSGPVTVTQPNHSSGRPSSPRPHFRFQ